MSHFVAGSRAKCHSLKLPHGTFPRFLFLAMGSPKSIDSESHPGTFALKWVNKLRCVVYFD